MSGEEIDLFWKELGFMLIQYLEWEDIRNVLKCCRASNASQWKHLFVRASSYKYCMIKDRYMNVVKDIEKLKWCEKCSSQATNGLGFDTTLLPRVKYIRLNDANIVERISKFTAVQHFEAHFCYLGWEYLQPMVHLKTLSLVEVSISSFEFLSSFTVLESLKIYIDEASAYLPHDWTPFKELKNLQELDIYSRRDVDPDLSQLSTLVKLHSLTLHFSSFLNLRFLADLSAIQNLSLTTDDEEASFEISDLTFFAIYLKSLKKLDSCLMNGIAPPIDF